MRAEIIVIGDELLSGKVIDTNSAEVARALAGLGIGVNRVVRVGDDETAIKTALAGALVFSRLVFLIGGLGGTPDDRTLNAVCELLGRRIVTHQPTLRRMSAIFARRGMRMPELARRYALVPEGAEVFTNPVGMVPGMLLKHQESTVALLPGVPQELLALTGELMRYLKEKGFSHTGISQHRLRTFGLLESRIAPKVLRIIRRYPNLEAGFYPGVSGLDILISGPDKKAVSAAAEELRDTFKDAVFAEGERSLAEVLGELLRQKGFTIATAESCTGGLVGDLLTNVPGSSDYYLGGVVAYSNRVKMKVLGVRERTLSRWGAVSAQTVKEMADGVRKLLGSDTGVGVSGIAGPTGGTKKKPVGTVYIGVAVKGKKLAKRFIFSGDRRLIKERSAYSALDLCRRILKNL